jgi:hypothetical protein
MASLENWSSSIPLLLLLLLSSSSSFSKLVVSPSSERAHRAGSSPEETSFDEESSSSLALLNGRRFFDVVVESSASYSLTYLRLFSEEVIGVTKWNLLSYKCQHSCLYGVIREPSNEACTTVQWRGAMLELLIRWTMITSASPIAVVILSSDGRIWHHLSPVATELMGRWCKSRPSNSARCYSKMGCVATVSNRSSVSIYLLLLISEVKPNFNVVQEELEGVPDWKAETFTSWSTLAAKDSGVVR